MIWSNSFCMYGVKTFTLFYFIRYLDTETKVIYLNCRRSPEFFPQVQSPLLFFYRGKFEPRQVRLS